MSREVLFDKNATCDVCGAIGAYDFMGDYACEDCAKDSYDELDDFFSAPQNINQKAWGLINMFYHMVLTHMENNRTTKADLARKLNKSRSAISQMFNKTSPNITIKK